MAGRSGRSSGSSKTQRTRFARYQASRRWARVDIGPSSPAATTGQSNLTTKQAQLLQVFIDTVSADLGYLSMQRSAQECPSCTGVSRDF